MMHTDCKIISLTLTGYTRMRLNNVKKFTIRFNERLQQILGTNGSGKSSLLAELSPMPPNKNDFEEDGYKEWVGLKNGHVYRLTSTMGSGGLRHSFIVDDGDEMNPGGTAAVQKELIWQEFGLDQEIYNLISGRENFTDMGPTRRREWFTRLSEVSYDFAITFYNKLKERVRDTNGAIRIQKKYLVEESRKLVSDKELAELTIRQGEMQTLLTSLFSITKPKEDPAQHARELNQKMSELDQLNRRLSPILKTFEIDSALHLDRIETEEAIALHNQTYTKYLSLMESHSVELEDVSQKYELLMQRGQETLQSLKLQETEHLEQKQRNQKRYRTTVKNYMKGSALAALSNFMQVKDELIDVLDTILPNPEGFYSKVNLGRNEQGLELVVREMRAREQRAELLRNRISQAKCQHQEGNVTCPSCDHTWSLSDTTNIIQQSEEELSQVLAEEVIDKLKRQESELNDLICQHKQYAELFTRLYQAGRMLNSDYFGEMWSNLFTSEDIRMAPKKLALLVHDIANDLEVMVEDEDLDIKLAEIHRLIAISKDTEMYNADDLKSRIDKLSNLIFEYNINITNANKMVQDCRSHLAKLNAIERADEQYGKLFQECYDINADLALAQLNQAVWQKVNDTQIALSMVTERITNAQMQQGIIDDISKKIVSLEEEKKLLDMMVSHMSPSEGLIADGLMGFIASYMRQVNSVIRKIWAYPLVILTENKEEIDYKFPMLIQHKTKKPVEDVSDGSSGMREVVNLAFRIIAMKHLGLGGMWLSLDEFGSSMDEAHKANAVELIKSLIDQEGFSQIFMVSHDKHQYGALPNGEVCVVCGDNITIPDGMVINKHVVFG